MYLSKHTKKRHEIPIMVGIISIIIKIFRIHGSGFIIHKGILIKHMTKDLDVRHDIAHELPHSPTSFPCNPFESSQLTNNNENEVD